MMISVVPDEINVINLLSYQTDFKLNTQKMEERIVKCNFVPDDLKCVKTWSGD